MDEALYGKRGVTLNGNVAAWHKWSNYGVQSKNDISYID